jgi:hypothetical protein
MNAEINLTTYLEYNEATNVRCADNVLTFSAGMFNFTMIPVNDCKGTYLKVVAELI